MQITVTGIIKWATLDQAERHPNFPNGDPKFRVTFNTPKENNEVRDLLEVVRQVAFAKWGNDDEAKKRFKGIERTVVEGDNEGTIGLLDGDAFKPEYNSGQYVIKASAKEKERPRFRTVDGSRTDEAPKGGDMVKVLLDVWCMAQHKRVNFTVQAIRMVQAGFQEIGAPEINDDLVDAHLAEGPSEETLALFSGNSGFRLEAEASVEAEPVIPHATEPEEKPKRKRGRPRKAKVQKEEGENETAEAVPPGDGDSTSLFDGL